MVVVVVVTVSDCEVSVWICVWCFPATVSAAISVVGSVSMVGPYWVV